MVKLCAFVALVLAGRTVCVSGLSSCATAWGVQDIYPDDHWQYSTKLTEQNADEFVKTNVDAGKTVYVRWVESSVWGWWRMQAPAWNAIVKEFADNEKVVFGDVLLCEQKVTHIHDKYVQISKDGWPTMRYYNADTGYGGKLYPKLTSEILCKELSMTHNGEDFYYMRKYVKDYSASTSGLPSGFQLTTAQATTVFKPSTGTELKNKLKACLPGPSQPISGTNIPGLSSLKFERLNKKEPNVSFRELYGSVVFGVRRMGWRLCREGAMQITKAAKDRNVRLVAIAKERLGHEEFTRGFWPPPAELYFDKRSKGFPFFKKSNGQKQSIASMLTSYMFGGKVAKNLKRTEHIAGDLKGEGLILGSVMVVSSTGQVLFHHKETVVGDHPDSDKLTAAINLLGSTGVAVCECAGEG